MSPADGANFDFAAENAVLSPDLAIILPGGRTLLALSQLDIALPRRGFCGDAAWRAVCWPTQDGRAGIALVHAPLIGDARLRGPAGEERHIGAPRSIDVAPTSLADFVRRTGLNSNDIFDFLTDALMGTSPDAQQHSDRDFAARFLALATDADGFIEILACPDTGGLFAQGWAMSLAPGRHRLARLDGQLQFCEADVAVFSREDISPPGMGFCLFSLDWRAADLDRLDCIYYEQNGTLTRLEIVRATVLKLRGDAATEHVRQMLPRLAQHGEMSGAHRRICRPKYQGIDTLSSTQLPIAAAFDVLFQAPTGGLLALGWLLDPLHHVERVILKSKSGLYAPLHDRWHLLPRADLNDGFANDPRFARLLDPADSMHGFMAYAKGDARQDDDEFYLELVLDEMNCLFRPLQITSLHGREMLPRILGAVPMHDPALDGIISETLAPFLAELPAKPHNSRTAQRPISLSDTAGEITAVIPLSRMDHFKPMMAMLSGTPEAERLDLVVVMSRGEAGSAAALKDLFAFYRISGRLLLVADRADLCTRIEAGLALATGPRVLLWQPSALPSTPGWLQLLEAELAGLGTQGLISPTLVYEDGSIFYGGDDASADSDVPMLGYPLGWLTRGAPRLMPTGAAQLALIDRDAMAKVGGLSGQLYSDAMFHQDLARRLHQGGYGIWSSRNVDFWMLEDPPRETDANMRLLERVDSELMDNIGQTFTGDRLR